MIQRHGVTLLRPGNEVQPIIRANGILLLQSHTGPVAVRHMQSSSRGLTSRNVQLPCIAKNIFGIAGQRYGAFTPIVDDPGISLPLFHRERKHRPVFQA